MQVVINGHVRSCPSLFEEQAVVLTVLQRPHVCPLTLGASLSVDFHIAVIAYPCSHRVLALTVIAYLGNYFKQMLLIYFSLCILVVFIFNLKSPSPMLSHSCNPLFQLIFNLHLNAIALKSQMLKGKSLGFHVGSSYEVSLCSENYYKHTHTHKKRQK